MITSKESANAFHYIASEMHRGMMRRGKRGLYVPKSIHETRTNWIRSLLDSMQSIGANEKETCDAIACAYHEIDKIAKTMESKSEMISMKSIAQQYANIWNTKATRIEKITGQIIYILINMKEKDKIR